MKNYLWLLLLAASGLALLCWSRSAKHDALSGYISRQFVVGRDPGSVEVADLNQDGKPDLAVANGKDNNVTILSTNRIGIKLF